MAKLAPRAWTGRILAAQRYADLITRHAYLSPGDGGVDRSAGPFLDSEMVDFASRLPARLKLRGATGKYLFRHAMDGLLPRSILTRRKAPFGVPVRAWLRHDLRPMVDDLLSEPSVRRRGYFNYPAVRHIIDQGRQSIGKSAHQLWALLMFEIWQQVFIDRTMTP